MTVAGPRRIRTGFLRRHRLTGNSVASLNAAGAAVAEILRKQLGRKLYCLPYVASPNLIRLRSAFSKRLVEAHGLDPLTTPHPSRRR